MSTVVIHKRFSLALKRSFDVAVAIALLTILGPLLVVVSVVIGATMGTPILFRQQRPGRNGRIFTMLKFRTMSDRRDPSGALLDDSARTTRLGALLRKTSVDEIPELLNVIRGDMSLVGPRPLLIEYMDRYTPEQRRRHEMRPGITGLAQVSGRQNIPFSRRIELDVRYVDEWSLALDARILAMTIPSVLGSRGVITGQDVTEVDDLAPATTRSPTDKGQSP